MPDPTPPEPIFDANLYTDLGTLSQWSWTSDGVSDPNGAALGHLQNANGTVMHIGPAKDGAMGSVSWRATTSPGAGFVGLLMTQGDAGKILTSGASVSSGYLVSGGNTYAGKQHAYDRRTIVLKLV